MSKSRFTAFVIMPFDSELDEVYTLFLQETLTEEGFDVIRADNINNQQNILNDIVDSIVKSDIVIADLTNSNANVYYELGIAHTFDKPVILLTQDIDEVPFDLRGYRLLDYNVHFAKINEAKQRLRDFARGFAEGTSIFSNPVSDYKKITNPTAFTGGNSQIISKEKRETNSENLADDTDEVEDDRGFLDHLEVVDDSFSNLNDIMQARALDIAEIGGLTRAMTEDLKNLNEDNSSGATTRKRKRLQQFANQLDEITNRLKESNKDYQGIADNLNSSLDFVINYQSLSEENAEALNKYLEELRELKQAGTDALVSMRGMIDSMQNIPNVERKTNRALRLLTDETQHMADNIEKTVATASRGINLAEDILARFKAVGHV